MNSICILKLWGAQQDMHLRYLLVSCFSYVALVLFLTAIFTQRKFALGSQGAVALQLLCMLQILTLQPVLLIFNLVCVWQQRNNMLWSP